MSEHEQDRKELEPSSGANPSAELVSVDQAHQRLAEQLVAQARERGVELVGEDGLLTQVTRQVLESALEAEMADHLGYNRGQPRAVCCDDLKGLPDAVNTAFPQPIGQTRVSTWSAPRSGMPATAGPVRPTRHRSTPTAARPARARPTPRAHRHRPTLGRGCLN